MRPQTLIDLVYTHVKCCFCHLDNVWISGEVPGVVILDIGLGKQAEEEVGLVKVNLVQLVKV